MHFIRITKPVVYQCTHGYGAGCRTCVVVAEAHAIVHDCPDWRTCPDDPFDS